MSELIQARNCFRCKRMLPLTAEYFHRNSFKKSGFADLCKRCTSEYTRQLPLKEARFWKYVDRRGPDECWNWQGGTNKSKSGAGGYGVFGRTSSHRFAWQLAHGPIPRGLFVLHKCDNRRCCNPTHLFLGTQLDNMRDMIAKGRQQTAAQKARGERQWRSRTTANEVIELRRLRSEGLSLRMLAQRFNMSRSTVCHIVKRRCWMHV